MSGAVHEIWLRSQKCTKLRLLRTCEDVRIQIFSAVPVFGMNESYIALLAEGQDDIWHPETYPWWETLQKTVLLCSGPGRSHVTQMEVPGLLRSPEDRHEKTIDISLDPHGLLLLWWRHMRQNC